MKYPGRALALIGVTAAAWLVWREHPATVFRLLKDAGAGLVLAALVHVLPMLANAWDWRSLIRAAQRPRLSAMLKLVWIRESVNGLLPVARIGGEIVSFRLLGRVGARPATAVASLVVDMQLTLISQVVFALAAACYVLYHGSPQAAAVMERLAGVAAVAVPVLLLFALVQHARPFERAARVLNQMTSGKLVALIGRSARIDQSVKLIWRQRGVVVRYLCIWQTLQCVGFACELWLALHFLGTDVSFAQAFVLEALIQMLSSAAFLVPAGLGVQEGGFVVIGGLLGLTPETCLALAGARRIRDLLIYLPGLLAWQVAEHSPASSRQPAVRADRFTRARSTR